MRPLKLLLLGAVVAGAPALAQPAPETSPAAGEPRVNQLIIYGDDPCPASTEAEIIVCARQSEGERYRIPENLRELDNPRSKAWATRAIELSYVGRTGTDSCSTTGPGGFTGCLNQIIDTASEERENRDSVNWNRLIEEARQERLGRIDAQSEAIERELDDRPR